MALYPDQRLREALESSGVQDFRNSAMTTAEVKVNRDANQRCEVCDAAAHGGKPLQVCGVGKMVSYCSKKCQKQNWPEHKKFCGASDDWEPMRLWKILQSNKVLVSMLLTAYIHRFDLLDKPTLEQPFFGRVHIGIEPEDLMDFFKIYMDPSTDASAMRGMVQINAISRVKFPTGVHELDVGFLSSWKAAQTRPYMQSYPTASYGVIWIDLPGLKNRHLSIVAIPVEAFDIARSARPFTTVSVYEGIQERPLSVESCLQYINHHIRSDLEDQIMLRTALRDIDVEVIKDAALGNDALAATMLRLKMATDGTYSVKTHVWIENASTEKDDEKDQEVGPK